MALPSDDAALALTSLTQSAQQATGGSVPTLELALTAVTPDALPEETPDNPVIPEPLNGPMPDPNQPVQVAGLGKWYAKRVLDAERRTLSGVPEKPVTQMGDVMVVRPMELDEALKTFEDLTMPTDKGAASKGLNIPRVANELQLPDVGQYMQRVKELNIDLFNSWRNPQTVEQIIAKAKEKGADEHLIEWMTRSNVNGVAPDEAVGGYIAWMALAKETRDTFTAALKIADPAEKDLALIRPLAMLNMLGELGAKVSGSYSQAARTTMMAGNLKKVFGIDIPAATADIESMLTNPEIARNAEFVGQTFISMPNAKARETFAEQSMYAKSMDKLAEVYVNSILSGIPTHLKNIAGNASMITTRMIETGFASGIGRMRSTADRYEMADVVAQIHGIKDGALDALIIGSKAWWTEESSDFMSKIELRNHRAIGTTGNPAEIWSMIREGDYSAAFVNTIGTYLRMSGRFMLAEDEFFKAINKRIYMSEASEKAYREAYGLALRQGKAEGDAITFASAERTRVANDLKIAVDGPAEQYARKMVFQGDLTGKLARLEGIMATPEMKIFGITFFRTPVQIMSAVTERTPLVGMMHPNFVSAMKEGGRAADMAWSKQLFGSMIFGTAMWLGTGLDSDGVVTLNGSGPSDPEAKKAMGRLNRGQCSLNIKMDDGSVRNYSINGLADPASALICMAADAQYISQYETDGNALSGLYIAATAGLWEYQLDQPYLQSLKEFMPILQAKDPKEAVNLIERYIAKRGSDALLSVIPFNSSFMAGIARTEDPTVKSTMPPMNSVVGNVAEMPHFVRGFYEAWERMLSRNPFLANAVDDKGNPRVPPALNVWGEKMVASNNPGWEWINPVKIKDVKHTRVDEELVRLGGISEFDKKINGIDLSREEYNRWITITNTMTINGKMPGDDGYDEGRRLLPMLNKLIESGSYQGIATKDKKLEAITNIVGQFRESGRERLLQEFSDLKTKVLRGKPKL